ncbi:uncharacterized protein PV06_01176 [Exophiala oligosperma]|uniref:O-methyltransferase n=2 Tax=Chaetothyriales TaxID=34395 RepID=A0A0D2E1G0_9EURO|nr:uncharacterized protein PV06_01176 [Exophiala oligosperma]KAJ9636027.1 hypothetical protein H2204_005524 [Knufia peltigerae]KIW48605.1 hypothetical protein PV06_01176 [Exophiala oligosperma]
MAPRSASSGSNPRWKAVEEYTSAHLLNPVRNMHHDILEFAHRNSLEKGLPDIAVDPSQGKSLSIQVQLTGAKNILEVGTLGGYSSIWLAIGAGKTGKVTSIEVDPHHKAVAEENIARAGMSEQISVLLGTGTDILPRLVEEVKNGKREPFDFVFIDADKQNNLAYFESALQMIRPRTCIYVDNVVRGGRIVEEQAIQEDSRVAGTRQLIEAVGKDDRVDAVVLQTVGSKNYDGYLLAVVK